MEKLRLTVAPGRRITLDPHPSKFPGLEPLVLESGDTLFAEPEEAERLFQAGQVLSLATGRPIERRAEPEPRGVRIRYGDGPFQDSSSGLVSHPNWAALAQQKAPEPPRKDIPAPEYDDLPAPGYDPDVGF